MKRLALVLGMALLMAAGQAMAQVYRHEVSTYGNWTHFSKAGQSTNVGIFELNYGYFFTPQFLGTLNYTRVSSDGFGYQDYGLGLKYYFGIGRRSSFIPFIDGSVGEEKTAAERKLLWKVGGGFSYFVTEATSFDTGLHYYKVHTDPSFSGTVFGVGFTTRF